jgi:cytochrome c553
MKRKQIIQLCVVVLFAVSAIAFYSVAIAQQQKVTLPQHPPASGDGKNMVLQLCDGETNLELKGVNPNERLTPEQAQKAANQLMMLWLAKQNKSVADAWLKETREALLPQEDKNKKKGQTTTQTNEQPNDFSQRDYAIWQKELAREIEFGNQIFHDDKLLGSTNGVSCAMCHPNAANTHPETYPKFQIQLKRVALLRDMINWCIENPSRGIKMEADDPRMRAMEAYIMAQRKGVPMNYGKH